MKWVVNLFCRTPNMAQPWVDNGYSALLIDINPDADTAASSNIITVERDLREPYPVDERMDIRFVAAFPPCDHLAVSGARWFKGKGLRALQDSIAMFATAAEFCESSGAPYMIENPVSTISTYWRKPDYIFHPWQYAGYEPTDDYTKKTCLWTGNGFVMPDPKPLEFPDPDDLIHKAPPGDGRSDFRSATPRGFARAVYEANK